MSRSAQRRKKKIHWWSRGSGIRLRIWMLVNVLLLSGISYGVYTAVTSNGTTEFTGLGSGANQQQGLLAGLALPKKATVPTKDQFLSPDGVYFGAATKGSPYSVPELQTVTTAAGVAPSMTEYFVNWTQSFNPAAITAAYKNGTLPVVSWEPWAGGQEDNGALRNTISSSNINQPKYRLANVYNGDFDSYITAFATAVAAEKWPVVLRFAHEMNGHWYPWSEQVNGNKAGDYVKAYRHVYDLFQQAGATNVIWSWSPNIIRPVPNVKLSALYPGDKYVDWVGLTGYGVNETSADQTFDATLTQLATVTKKPILITETGAQPGKQKAEWIASFFPWLKKHTNVIGFIWTEKDEKTGANADWRFDSDTMSLSAFTTGLSQLSLANGTATSTSSATPEPSTSSSAK